jgi:alkylation response protein AidB-like acyl-CoA dehydrogenase
MPVPAGNILGPLGKGLKVALTVLDFGRTTFGASCTGAAKTALAAAVAHARRRRQFGRTLGEFELIKKKLARIAAFTYAVEATTRQTAALIDSGAEDYMLETAILKVFATEALWEIVYETLQIHGGQGYFTDEPFERMMRDARINQLGEGANEVLKSFIAVVGLRDVGMDLLETAKRLQHPREMFPALWKFGSQRASRLLRRPDIPVAIGALGAEADALAGRVSTFGWVVEKTLFAHRDNPEAFLDRQYIHERLADAAIALVTSACTLSRLVAAPDGAREAAASDRAAGELYLRLAARRFDQSLRELRHNDDALVTHTADALLGAAD